MPPSVFVDALVLMLQGGGQSLRGLRELEREGALRKRVGCEEIPHPDTVGEWLRRMGLPAGRQEIPRGSKWGSWV